MMSSRGVRGFCRSLESVSMKAYTNEWSSSLRGACACTYVRMDAEREMADSCSFPTAALDAAKGPPENERSWRRSKRIRLASSRDITGKEDEQRTQAN